MLDAFNPPCLSGQVRQDIDAVKLLGLGGDLGSITLEVAFAESSVEAFKRISP